MAKITFSATGDYALALERYQSAADGGKMLERFSWLQPPEFLLRQCLQIGSDLICNNRSAGGEIPEVAARRNVPWAAEKSKARFG